MRAFTVRARHSKSDHFISSLHRLFPGGGDFRRLRPPASGRLPLPPPGHAHCAVLQVQVQQRRRRPIADLRDAAGAGATRRSEDGPSSLFALCFLFSCFLFFSTPVFTSSSAPASLERFVCFPAGLSVRRPRPLLRDPSLCM